MIFQYNGFTVRAVGPVERVSGGHVCMVEIVDPPAFIIDRRFSAVVDSNGKPLKR